MNITDQQNEDKDYGKIKSFSQLIDQDMKNKLRHYVRLYTEYLVLKNRVNNWKMHFVAKSNSPIDENISFLLTRADMLYSFLDQEFKYLNGNIYVMTNHYDFLRKTQNFKKMLKIWDKTLQKLHYKIYKLEKREWQKNYHSVFKILNKQSTK